MLFGLVANLNRPGAREAIAALIEWTAKSGQQLILSDDLRNTVADHTEFAAISDLAGKVDMLVAMGGDGTILSTARSVGTSGTPILGINLGHLGFLTQQTPEQLAQALEAVLVGQYTIEERILLEASIEGRDPLPMPYALNDVVLDHGGTTRVLTIHLKVNGEDAVTYTADGLIIATPTGSTAYNLAVGGPIVYPSMDAMIASPIAPFSLTTRPMIIPGGSKLELSVHTAGRKAQLTLDGQIDVEVLESEKVVVSRADLSARFVVFPENAYFSLLRRKLHWGIPPES